MSKISISLQFLLFLVLFSCGDGQPKTRVGILTENQMVELLVDTHVVDAVLFVDNSKSEEKRDKALYYYPSILEKHGITKAQMDSSVSWYMKNPAAYLRIYERVVKALEKQADKEKKPEIME